MNADAAFTETNHAEMKPMSGMAVTAFVLTLLFCIPVLPLVGLLLGLAALGRTATPGGTMRGRPLAVTAIIVGVLVTAGQVYTTVKMVEVAKIIADAFEVVVNGPEVALGAAFKGDSPEATEWWWPGSEPSAAKTAAFAADCRGRFGEFVSVVIIDDFQPPMGQTTFHFQERRVRRVHSIPGGDGWCDGADKWEIRRNNGDHGDRYRRNQGCLECS